MNLKSDSISQPHDKFFKTLLDQPGAASAFLRERLPEHIARKLASVDPELVDGNFTDRKLRNSIADRLYRAKLIDGRDIYFLCLLEHKSRVEPRVALQLLKYQLNVWLRHDSQKQSSGLLPAIIPIVIYHGAKPWNISPNFSALVDASDDMRPNLLDFQYVLVDLGRIPEEKFSAHPSVRAGFIALKWAMLVSRENLQEATTVVIRALVEAPEEMALMTFRYMIGTYEWLDAGTLAQVLEKVAPRRKDQMVSLAARQWMAEGKAEGEAIGEERGEKKALQRILERRFGPLPDDYQLRLSKASISDLDTWIDRALEAANLKAVFG